MEGDKFWVPQGGGFGVGMEMWAWHAQVLAASRDEWRIPSWKINACASASLLWGIFLLFSSLL